MTKDGISRGGGGPAAPGEGWQEVRRNKEAGARPSGALQLY